MKNYAWRNSIIEEGNMQELKDALITAWQQYDAFVAAIAIISSCEEEEDVS